jgi:hypothetical protein
MRLTGKFDNRQRQATVGKKTFLLAAFASYIFALRYDFPDNTKSDELCRNSKPFPRPISRKPVGITPKTTCDYSDGKAVLR